MRGSWKRSKLENQIWLRQKRTSRIQILIMCVKELENTSLACSSNRDLVSSENLAPSPASDPDLLSVGEQAILCEILDTIDSDDSDNNVVVSSASVYSVCSNCKQPPKKGEDL